jgi:phage tail-like protein
MAATPGRGAVPGLPSPHALGAFLPGLYQEPDPGGVPNLTQRLTAALDGVLAPVFLSLDNFAAYLDPRLTPEDFLEWLAGWLGLSLDERWPIERRRELFARAVTLYRLRGTARGIALHVAAFAGVEPEVVESGGSSWSTTPDGPLPGDPTPRMTVRLAGADPEFDADRLRALVESIKPAHVPADVEVVP